MFMDDLGGLKKTSLDLVFFEQGKHIHEVIAVAIVKSQEYSVSGKRPIGRVQCLQERLHSDGVVVSLDMVELTAKTSKAKTLECGEAGMLEIAHIMVHDDRDFSIQRHF